MDDNFSEMVKNVMSDPDTMQKLMGVAQNLMGDSTKKSDPAPSQAEKEDDSSIGVSSLVSHISGGNEERIALIAALRPYLSPKRKKSADSLIKMLKMMKLADLNKLFRE